MIRIACVLALVLACGDDDEPDVDAALLDSPTPDVFLDGPVQCISDADCSDDVFCNGIERCDRTRFDADENGCVPGDEPCAVDRCDEGMRRCLTDCDVMGDMDMDGAFSIECAGGDCDDSDPGRFPGNEELCDEMDQDCDDRIDEGCG